MKKSNRPLYKTIKFSGNGVLLVIAARLLWGLWRLLAAVVS